MKSYTHVNFSQRVAKAIDGYGSNLDLDDDVNILIIDSATTGRLAVLYYRNLNKELYLSRLKQWHSTCVWQHRYRKSKQGATLPFLGAPSPKDIAFAAYGAKADEKLIKGLIERIFPCIVDGQEVPTDILRNAIQRASKPTAMERWEWEKNT